MYAYYVSALLITAEGVYFSFPYACVVFLLVFCAQLDISGLGCSCVCRFGFYMCWNYYVGLSCVALSDILHSVYNLRFR